MTEEKNILEITNLKKHFGEKKVLQGVDLKIPEKKVFGFVGKNGAGKTTTMKCILGLLEADEGEILVNGEKVTYGDTKTNRFIGYLPDVPEYYSYMNPKEYLSFCGEITGMEKKTIKSRSEELLELVGLGGEKHRIKGFSRGMKQRLGIAQALLNSPRLLICDEPTSALDPVGRKEILDILVAAKNETTILFSTHILSDVEHICDEMAMLHAGKIIMQGSITEVKEKRRGNTLELQLENPEENAMLLNRFTKVTDMSEPAIESTGSNTLLIKDELMVPDILRFLADRNIRFIKMEKQEATLEDIFIEAIQN